MMQSERRRGLGGILDLLYLWAGYAAGCLLVVIFLLMMALSAGRQFRLNIPSGDDYAAWSMAAMAFLGLAHTFKSGEMIRVGLLIDRLTGRTRHVVEIVSLAIGLACIVPVPLWIPQIGFVAGIVLLTVAFLDELIRVLSGRKPTYEKEPPRTAEEVIERAAASAV
jgi:TRAP-type C4-dicarboxylate transport system permease small subunit